MNGIKVTTKNNENVQNIVAKLLLKEKSIAMKLKFYLEGQIIKKIY